jgi:hypothetical protein
VIGVIVASASLAAWSIIATLVVTARDGYRAVPTLEH